MKNGDIIEVVRYDDEDGLHVRRIKVTQLREVEGRYCLVGVNLHGNNPIRYNLPLEPVDSVYDVEDGAAWLEVGPAITLDE